MYIIECSDLQHRYPGRSDTSLQDVSLQIQPGEFVAILGCNGCGKSTLLRHFNALLRLQQGDLRVAGIDLAGDPDVWELRRSVGMVFQNPDNQFVSPVVEDDIAFGPENYQIPRAEIPAMVEEALRRVGMTGFGKRAPHSLSGGQKQRIAIAGMLAMDPDVLLLDEATTMLDPSGRKDILGIIRRLHQQQQKTIIMITHYMEESLLADRLIIMKDGQMIAQGPPAEILPQEDVLAKAGLKPPPAVQLYLDLKQAGIQLPRCPLTEEELADMICQSDLNM